MSNSPIVNKSSINSEIDIPKMCSPDKFDTILDFQKMIFIYNAVNDGWTVKILPDGKYEFSKKDLKYTSIDCLDTYLKSFIKNFMTLKSTKNSK